MNVEEAGRVFAQFVTQFVGVFPETAKLPGALQTLFVELPEARKEIGALRQEKESLAKDVPRLKLQVTDLEKRKAALENDTANLEVRKAQQDREIEAACAQKQAKLDAINADIARAVENAAANARRLSSHVEAV